MIPGKIDRSSAAGLFPTDSRQLIHQWYRLARHQIIFVTLVLVLDIMPTWAMAMDRSDLGQVLQMMPPNGPAEQYGNVILRRRSKKAKMAPVVFPHWSHRALYTCRVCHGELDFAMRSGASGIKRDGCLAGKYCGTCHNGKTAFSTQDGPKKHCDRCHIKDNAQLNERFSSFAATLPTAPFGNKIDWAAALNQGRITPKKTLLPNAPPVQFPDALRKPLSLGTSAPRSAVSFSHEEHMEELDCASCHPDIFNIKKRGTQLFSMEVNLYGQFCGTCHMRVAFPMDDCRRCHPEMSNKKSGY